MLNVIKFSTYLLTLDYEFYLLVRVQRQALGNKTEASTLTIPPLSPTDQNTKSFCSLSIK